MSKYDDWTIEEFREQYKCLVKTLASSGLEPKFAYYRVNVKVEKIEGDPRITRRLKRYYRNDSDYTQAVKSTWTPSLWGGKTECWIRTFWQEGVETWYSEMLAEPCDEKDKFCYLIGRTIVLEKLMKREGIKVDY